jgi:tRNA pseudouridine38-40 synthase
MRYFIEVAYIGTNYAGFQIQETGKTIQGEIEKALFTFYRENLALTGSSRTDSGVHALQNYFMVDTNKLLEPKHIYNLNAILSHDIVIKNIIAMPADAHCRFMATHRRYQYFMHQVKNPFLQNTSWYYPYVLNVDLLNQCAAILMETKDFTSFSKKHTQAKTMLCTLTESNWQWKNEQLVYTVCANRFLRGMVRGLVGTMLQVGRGKKTIGDFEKIIAAKNCNMAEFSTPAHGLFLMEVVMPNGTFA